MKTKTIYQSNRSVRVTAILLALLIVFSLVPVVHAEDEENIIHITSAEDLQLLSSECTLDTWSQGITVELDCDISLENSDFTPIPSFGGTFHGNGHTISGFNLTGKYSSVGLFRTVQEDGCVEKLNVIGTLDLSGDCEAAGGIAGVNQGTISGCSFSGSIEGNVSTGGIAGRNEVTGTVQNCSVSGSVLGDRMTGGIAGKNLGSITGCVNASYVNAVNSDSTLSTDNLTLDFSFDLARLENISTPVSNTDSGGIAGYSSGVVRSCTNNAVIGYSHVGYHIGGIVGRSCGYITDCENTGAVYGRKDVGGIVGQMEPYLESQLTESTLDVLRSQLDELNNLVNQAISDAEGGSSGISSRLNKVSDSVGSAVNAAYDVSVVIDAGGSASASGEAEGSGEVTVTPPSVEIEGEAGSIEIGGAVVLPGAVVGGSGSAAAGDITVEGSTGEAAANGSTEASGQAEASAQIVATPNLNGLTSSIQSIGSQISQLNSAISGTTSQVAEDVRAINEQFNLLSNTLFDAVFDEDDSTENLLTDVSEIDVDLITLGKVSNSENRNIVEGDINTGGIAGAVVIEAEGDPEEDITDQLSLEYKQQYTMKAVIQSCDNYGAVTGKRSYAGGICGRMDFGLLTDCGGYGSVKSESGNYVGGIAGMTAATIRNSYAKCTLSGSSYVGGIVGAGVTETLTGSVSSVSGCRSMVEIQDAEEAYGAVSGSLSGDYLENCFVSDTLAGIDGQSYSGKAEPISYDALLEEEGTPDEMRHLTLQFVDGDEVLKTIEFEYGDSFDSDVYPELPQEEGNYAYWDKTELTNLHFDTVVFAEHESYVETLASDAQRDSGRSVFLVQGDYSDPEIVAAQSLQKSTAGFAPLSSGILPAVKQYLTSHAWYQWVTSSINRDVVEQWHITVPEDGQESHTIRYLTPDETTDGFRIYVRQDEDWKQVETETFGSYLTFELTGTEADIALVSVLSVWWVGVVFLVLIMAAVILILVRRKRRRKRSEKEEPEEEQVSADGENSGNKEPKHKKRLAVLIMISAAALVVLLGVLWLLHGSILKGESVYRALSALNDQPELSASVSADIQLGDTTSHVETTIERKTEDEGKEISCVPMEAVSLYYSNNKVILENGTAYRLENATPDYAALLKEVVPLYQNLEFESENGSYEVTAQGDTAQKLLQLVLPDAAEQCSQMQQVDICVAIENNEVNEIELSASGTLTDDANTAFSVYVMIDEISNRSDFEIPQAVLEAAGEEPEADLPVFTEDALRLLSAWHNWQERDHRAAEMTVSVDCGPVVLRDSLKLYEQTLDGETIRCVSKNGINLYWNDSTAVNQSGEKVSGADAESKDTAKLLDVAILVSEKGDFTVTEQDNSWLYTLQLDGDALEQVFSVLVPELTDLDGSVSNGILTVRVQGDEITDLSISGTGTATVVSISAAASIAAQISLTEETISIPNRVLQTLNRAK